MKVLGPGEQHTRLAQQAQLDLAAVAMIITHQTTAYVYRWAYTHRHGQPWRRPVWHTELHLDACT